MEYEIDGVPLSKCATEVLVETADRFYTQLWEGRDLSDEERALSDAVYDELDRRGHWE